MLLPIFDFILPACSYSPSINALIELSLSSARIISAAASARVEFFFGANADAEVPCTRFAADA